MLIVLQDQPRRPGELDVFLSPSSVAVCKTHGLLAVHKLTEPDECILLGIRMDAVLPVQGGGVR